MADKEVIVYTETFGTTKLLAVDHHLVRLEQGKTIKFQNDVKSTGDDPDAGVQIEIIFEKMDGAGAGYFCKNDGPTLIIDANKHENCKVDWQGDIKYTVKAKTGYAPLDPVIIVEAPPLSVGHLAAAFLLGTVIFGALGYYLGFKKGSA